MCGPLILRRNIEMRCNGRLKPYTIACGMLPRPARRDAGKTTVSCSICYDD
jgi:hypothetical protein